MTSHDAIVEINTAIDRLRAVRDTLGKQLVDGSCQSSEKRQLSELHDRVAQTIEAYKRGN
ncbi:hypothetical protein [Shimia abyssi]|uniref:Uncharacterized protein n=1 Tax=Shimia abyssi TaxID=1662395 RepID=A0A2P8F8R6_9RHOB|nr:hypothetical protein [Shimia abyssi]PSL18098.1 hypothetical protein CLV88_11222 [Shimia abyssi]